MDAYRWRYELLLESMNKIAKTGKNTFAKPKESEQ